MDFKKFSYSNKDLQLLKNEFFYRLFFMILFSVILVWQVVLLFIETIRHQMQLSFVVASAIVLIVSLCFICVSLMYALKAKSTINTINSNGRCVSRVQILKSLNKTGFIKLYSTLCKFFALLISLVVVVAITYLVLQTTFDKQISFFYPFLFLCCALGYNTVFHIINEIKTMELVEEYHSLY